MPGPDPFAVIADLSTRCPDARVVVFTALMKREIITRAVTSGAWGFIFKDDGVDLLVSAVRSVAEGGFVLSDRAREIAGMR